ncbi:MAG: valine--tRNA ligase [Limisphaerales bacterium]
MPEIPKAYEPQAVEEKWRRFWLDQKCFAANPGSRKPAYSIVIPPPNVTGVLTLGHVLNNTIQDILARLARMKGREVLWLPGTDHAGIATQAVVEKNLRQQGLMKYRDDLGREKFLEKVWEWKEKHGGIIIQQLKMLGASCDWSRERFTMDPEYSRCVQRVFVDLYHKSLIYRGTRMVNWDPAACTALSDEEVEMVEQQGHLWYFKYPLAEGDGFVVVATTRPETMLGDEAVAVHPQDARYENLHGKKVLLPLRNKTIPIIQDELVDPKFGAGCVKVTPAHDPADYEMAQRHHLPLTVVIAPDGSMTETAGAEFAGLDRMEARKAVVAKMEGLGLLLKTEKHIHRVGHSQRSNAPIEPYLSEQWFLRYPSIGPSTTAVENGQIQFHPERWSKTYLHWMANIRDWCISRQLWWGHRIPVWYKDAEIRCQIDSPGEGWRQDPDVLDTWFSSWLWPFATMGWPEKTETLQKFYPTTDLVTGPDIIFFWVARMIMAGYEFMGEKPFAHVYFTGIIRDKQGRKMSKSLGNSPDPLDLIAKYGADALRFGVMRSAPLGQDILYDEQQVELGRNFCNKLWNACRFRQLQAGETQGEIAPELLTRDDQWILLRLDAAIRELDDAFANYKFSDATATLYRFFWSEYCDWYVEASKAVLQGTNAALRQNTLAVMDFVLSHTLRLFHPFLPFITEELWHAMAYSRDMPDDQGGKTIVFAPWPKALDADFKTHYRLSESILNLVEERQKLVIAVRNVRAQYRLPANLRLKLIYESPSDIEAAEKEVIQLLAGAESMEHRQAYQPAKGEPVIHPGFGGKLYIPLAGLVDVGAEKTRLTKEAQKIEAEIAKVQAKLENPNFAQKVPATVLEEHRQRLANWLAKRDQTRASLDAL